MKKIGDILNAIINPFGKSLWKGTWSSGSISVPDTDKYSVFILSQNGTPVIALKTGTTIRGFGISGQNSNNSHYTRVFGATCSGSTWNLQFNNMLYHAPSSSHGAGSSSSITEIIGLVPNWGGYFVTSKIVVIATMLKGGVSHENTAEDCIRFGESRRQNGDNNSVTWKRGYIFLCKDRSIVCSDTNGKEKHTDIGRTKRIRRAIAIESKNLIEWGRLHWRNCRCCTTCEIRANKNQSDWRIDSCKLRRVCNSYVHCMIASLRGGAAV